MRIVVLTPLNPVKNAPVYGEILRLLPEEIKDKVNVISFPYFAEIESHNKNKEYLPTLFSMMKSATRPEFKKTLKNKEHLVIVGNCYKGPYDFIVAFDEYGDEVFDEYIEVFKVDEDIKKNKKLQEMLKIDDLYDLKDANLVLPTIDHVVLFLKETLKNDKRK